MFGNPRIAARWIALIVPLALVGGALASQHIGKLAPCEMCYWQRWPHYAAIALALGGLLLQRSALGLAFTALAATGIAMSGGIGVFHAGVEYGWWQGITGCSAPLAAGSPEELLAQITRAPITRCDVAPWSLFGVSLAGYNALISLGSAALIAVLLTRRTGNGTWA